MYEFCKSHTPFQAEWDPMVARIRVVARERNEQGFHNFMQNLKAVFWLFLTPENGNLPTDANV